MINISLTVLFVIAVLFQMAMTFLAIDDWTGDGGPISALFVAVVVGLFITHGEYYASSYAWLLSHLKGDGWAGEVISSAFAIACEFFVAVLPMIGAVALYAVLNWQRKSHPYLMGSKRPQGFLSSFLRSLRIR